MREVRQKLLYLLDDVQEGAPAIIQQLYQHYITCLNTSPLLTRWDGPGGPNLSSLRGGGGPPKRSLGGPNPGSPEKKIRTPLIRTDTCCPKTSLIRTTLTHVPLYIPCCCLGGEV